MLWETVPWAVFRWGWGWAGNSNLSARGDSGIGLIVWALGGLRPHSTGRRVSFGIECSWCCCAPLPPRLTATVLAARLLRFGFLIGRGQTPQPSELHLTDFKMEEREENPALNIANVLCEFKYALWRKTGSTMFFINLYFLFEGTNLKRNVIPFPS